MKLGIKKGRMSNIQTSFQLSITVSQKNYLKSCLLLTAVIAELAGARDLLVQ